MGEKGENGGVHSIKTYAYMKFSTNKKCMNVWLLDWEYSLVIKHVLNSSSTEL